MKKTCTAALQGLLGAMIWTMSATASETFSVKHGDWELTADSASGAWQGLKWNGEDLLAAGAPSVPPLDLAVSAKCSKWLSQGSPFALIDRKWDETTGTLSLTWQAGEWEIGERTQFGALGNPDRLSRTAKLTYRPKSAEPAKFYKLHFNYLLPKSGKYLFPNVFGPNVPGEGPAGGECRDIGGMLEGNSWKGNVAPVLIEQAPGRTLLFICEGRREKFGLSIHPEANHLVVRPAFLAQGWAEPGVPQEIGPAFLEIHRQNLESARREAVWKHYAEIGLKVPADRPDWIYDSALYCFFPGGTSGSGWRDLGGFAAAREELLPRVAALGFGALWTLPVEELWVYRPRDYYTFAPNLGSADDYRALIRATHEAGLKFWQDNVPHGGTPEFGPVRGNSPFSLLFDENGDALDYWCWDFGDPQWQAYIRQVAAHYVRDFDVDGFRIDACGGSKMVNWRRQGFPLRDRTPKHVPEKWWQESVDAAGGSVPPLPYERGSLGLRLGGMQMIHGIREEVKKLKPRDGAILIEVQSPPYMQECDVIYDFTLAHRILPQYREMPPAQFTAYLSRWLEEQKYAEPRGTFRLRYTESHDTQRARGWVGVNGTRALTALTFWIHGMPMVYQDADQGEGPFLQRLNLVRKALPELRRGEAFYQAVTATPGEIFAVLRRLDTRFSVALVNLGAESTVAKLVIPAAQLPAADGQIWRVWNAWTGHLLREGRLEELGQLELPLAPWDTAVLAFRPATEACPIPEILTADPVGSGRAEVRTTVPDLAETAEALVVSGAGYRLTVDRNTGLPREFAAVNEPLLGIASLLRDARPDQSVATPAATVTHERQGETQVIRAVLPLPPAGSVEILYHCAASEVGITATTSGQIADARLGLLFTAPKCHRYQINTAEGRLDDWFSPRHTRGQASASGVYYRRQGSPVIWQADTQPLNPAAPFIRTFTASGVGAELAVDAPLTAGLANILALDKLAGQPGWRVAFLWRQPGVEYSTPTPGDRKFSLTLHPVSQPDVPAEAIANEAAADLPAGIRLVNDSRGWAVENTHYRARLLRNGGALAEVWRLGATPRPVLEDQRIYSDKGYIKADAKRSFIATNTNDGETAVRIWRDGQTLRLKFRSQLRGFGPYGSRLQSAVWAVTEYAFDSGPAFRMSWSLFCEGQPVAPEAFLAWQAGHPDWSEIILAKNGTELVRGRFSASQRTAECSGLPAPAVPDTLRILDSSGQTRLCLTELQTRSSRQMANVFAHGQKLFMTWVDGKDCVLPSREWHRASLAITPDKTPGIAPIIAWPEQETAPLVPDLGTDL